MTYRIGLIGSAGIGKSGVADKVAKRFGITFLRSKDITRPLLADRGFSQDKCECVEKFLSEKEMEYEIVDKKIRHEQLMSSGFVTDRTTLECFAYSLLSVEDYEPDEISMLERICKGNMQSYTHLFYFPYGNGWLEPNGVRTVNEYFQRKIDMLIRGLISDWKLDVTVVGDDPFGQIVSELAK